MAVQPINHGSGWSDEDIALLRSLAADKLPVSLISKKLGRTEIYVKTEAKKLEVELKAPRVTRLRLR